MLNDSDDSHLEAEKQSERLRLLAAVWAVVITALVYDGYSFWKHRTQQILARVEQTQEAAPNLPKGPPKAHILVDDALLKAGQTVIGGTVRNTSGEKLTGLSVGLELRRRKDKHIEQTTVAVEPPQLEPEE